MTFPNTYTSKREVTFFFLILLHNSLFIHQVFILYLVFEQPGDLVVSLLYFITDPSKELKRTLII